MGNWGIQPWQNDSAADWLDSFSKRTQLSERIEMALTLPDENIEDVRAAAYLLLRFAEAGTWLLDEPEQLVSLAIERLSGAIDSEIYTTPEFVEIVQAEVDALRRLFSDGTNSPDSGQSDQASVAAEKFGMTMYTVSDADGRIPESQAEEVVGNGFRGEDGVLHLRIEDGRPDGFLLKLRCPPTSGQAFIEENPVTE